MPLALIFSKLREIISSWRTIIILARKPDKEEFKLLARLTFLGFALVGAIAYIIHLVAMMLRGV